MFNLQHLWDHPFKEISSAAAMPENGHICKVVNGAERQSAL